MNDNMLMTTPWTLQKGETFELQDAERNELEWSV